MLLDKIKAFSLQGPITQNLIRVCIVKLISGHRIYVFTPEHCVHIVSQPRKQLFTLAIQGFLFTSVFVSNKTCSATPASNVYSFISGLFI